MMQPVVVVHGGAGRVHPEDHAQACEHGCLMAARAAIAVLRQGGSALDAVEAGAVVLEDDPTFNAGTGSTLNAAGEVEMDAMVMTGERLAGGVAGLQRFRNPIQIARRVLEASPHVLLAGAGAAQFALSQGFSSVSAESLITAAARLRWQQECEAGLSRKTGTIGVVARDQQGRVAAATSTGGISGKLPGRIGDTPLVGCGTYAEAATGAASSTGHGESIIRVLLAKRACDGLLTLGAQGAAEEAVAALTAIGGEGGIILVSKAGDIGLAFNTQRMSRAWIDGSGREGTGFGLGAGPILGTQP